MNHLFQIKGRKYKAGVSARETGRYHGRGTRKGLAPESHARPGQAGSSSFVTLGCSFKETQLPNYRYKWFQERRGCYPTCKFSFSRH